MRGGLRSLIPLAGVAALLALGGCGGGPAAPAGATGAASSASPTSALGKPPAAATLYSQTVAAMRAASSVRVNGHLTANGQAASLNLILTKPGDTYGTVGIGHAQFSVLTIKGSAYIKIDADFLKQLKLPSSACTLMCGKWVKMTAVDARSMTGDFAWSNVIGSMANSPAPPDMTVSGSTTVNGVPAWVLKSSDGSTLYVAALGTPYPLRVTETSGQTGFLDFTQWNSATIPPPPPANQVVDLGQLGG